MTAVEDVVWSVIVGCTLLHYAVFTSFGLLNEVLLISIRFSIFLGLVMFAL